MKQSNSIVGKKSYLFALEIVQVYKMLVEEKKRICTL